MVLGEIQFPKDMVGDAQPLLSEVSNVWISNGTLFQCSILNKSHFENVKIIKCTYFLCAISPIAIIGNWNFLSGTAIFRSNFFKANFTIFWNVNFSDSSFLNLPKFFLEPAERELTPIFSSCSLWLSPQSEYGTQVAPTCQNIMLSKYLFLLLRLFLFCFVMDLQCEYGAQVASRCPYLPARMLRGYGTNWGNILNNLRENIKTFIFTFSLLHPSPIQMSLLACEIGD